MQDDESHRAGARVLVGGGIGAGKSSVVEMFRRAGFHVIIADDIGRTVLQPGTEAVAIVEERWPSAVKDGELDRGALATIVFNDRGELATLEAITHPEIKRAIDAECEAHLDDDIVIETPVANLMGDAGFLKVAVVAAPELRLARSVTRGGARADVMARMGMQASDAEWSDWADVVIDNSGTPEELEWRVVPIIEEVRRG